MCVKDKIYSIRNVQDTYSDRKLSPTDWNPLLTAATASLYKQAIYCYDKTLEIDPNHGNAQVLKDRALVASNRWKRSMLITPPTEPGTLKVLSDTSYMDPVGSFHVVGEVGSAKLVMVIGTFYDASGTVVGTSFAYTDPHDLIPGDRAPFHLIFTSASTPANQIKHYSLQLKLE